MEENSFLMLQKYCPLEARIIDEIVRFDGFYKAKILSSFLQKDYKFLTSELNVLETFCSFLWIWKYLSLVRAFRNRKNPSWECEMRCLGCPRRLGIPCRPRNCDIYDEPDDCNGLLTAIYLWCKEDSFGAKEERNYLFSYNFILFPRQNSGKKFQILADLDP